MAFYWRADRAHRLDRLQGAEAEKAVEMFHNKDFQGRQLTVNIARPREDRPPMRGGGGYREERRERP